MAQRTPDKGFYRALIPFYSLPPSGRNVEPGDKLPEAFDWPGARYWEKAKKIEWVEEEEPNEKNGSLAQTSIEPAKEIEPTHKTAEDGASGQAHSTPQTAGGSASATGKKKTSKKTSRRKTKKSTK